MPSIINIQEKKMTLAKLESEVIKLRKENKSLKSDKKDLIAHNKFLIERLEQWAERNFQERQLRMNMTVDEVIAFNKNRHDYNKEKEIAKTIDEHTERLSNINNEGLAKVVNK